VLILVIPGTLRYLVWVSLWQLWYHSWYRWAPRCTFFSLSCSLRLSPTQAKLCSHSIKNVLWGFRSHLHLRYFKLQFWAL